MSKLLIIDKSAFQSISIDRLQDFANTHFVILPDVLYFECATTSNNKKQLLERFRDVIMNGAYICESWRSIIEKEAQNLLPYGPLVDLPNADNVRSTFRNNSTPYNPKNAEKLLRRYNETAIELIRSAGSFDEKMTSESPEMLREIHKWDSSKKGEPKRLCKWASLVDSKDIHKLAVAWLSDLTNNPKRFCLSTEWFTWQCLRLLTINTFEMYFLRHQGSTLGKGTVEHNLQDIQYVSLLSRADGLLTKDIGCASLAKAAFPEKGVFFGLDEVPSDYLC